MPKSAGKIARFILRWTIAVVGVAWVVSNIHMSDRVHYVDENDQLHEATLVEKATESDPFFVILDPKSGVTIRIDRSRTLSDPDRKTVLDNRASPPDEIPLLGMQLASNPSGMIYAERLFVQKNGRGEWLDPGDVAGGFVVDLPQPRVQEGVQTMVAKADRKLLIGAVAVLPLTYLFTTFRWHQLLKVLGIFIPLSRAFVLNMVGSFYNTFMLGSTGGDVLKAYYAAKQAPTRRTAAVMSVIVDRAIGLLALVILGGSMAAMQYATAEDRSDPVARRCLQVAIGAAVLLSGTLVFSMVVYWSGLRRALGLNALVARVPMQTQVQKIIEVVRLYRERPALMFWAVLMTFPVHLTVVVSAMLAGKAFGLPISSSYYFIVVPVVVLVGAIPLSPQGAGVMEAFAFYLTRGEGVTVNQALALTMSIRLVGMFWNLLGGLFVFRGGYHTPTEKEQSELVCDDAIGVISKEKIQGTNGTLGPIV